MLDSVRQYIRIRRPKPKKRKVHKPKTIKQSQSAIAQAAWFVLNRVRGEAITSQVIAVLIQKDQPDLLKGDLRAQSKAVHQALSRLDDVLRDNGRFWLPRREA